MAGPSPSVDSSAGFTSRWPKTAGPWHVIIALSAVDDTNPGNNTASSSFATVVAAPDVSASNISFDPSTPTVAAPGSQAKFSFQINGSPTQNGTRTLNWAVYATTSNALPPGPNGLGTLIASGSTGPLDAGASVLISGSSASGLWPLQYGNYYLRVQISDSEDPNLTNNMAVTPGAEPVGIYAESEPNNDVKGLSNANNLSVTLQPGMSVQVTGTLTAGDYDVFAFNTGTANHVTFCVYLAGIQPVGLETYVSPGGSIQSFAYNGGTSKWVALGWSPDSQNALRWIAVHNTAGPMPGSYTLIISAN
jgi:hypothetical protein